MSACKIRSYNYVRAALFGKKPTAMNRIIGLRSKPHSHSEFQFSERYDGVSFSATTMDSSNCARFKQIGYSHETERWDTVVVTMTNSEEDLAYAEAKKIEGTPYDIIGQLCHISKLKIWKPSKKKTWCDKAVAAVVYAAKQKFKAFIEKLGLINELRPDQLDMLARYYFRISKKS